MATILIVEDERVSGILVSQILDDMGHTHVMTYNGRQALDFLRAEAADVDMVITDVMMPELDGRQLILTMRGDASLKDLPIIIISAVVDSRDMRDVLGLGATSFVPKPIDPDTLREHVSLCLTD
ncbi:MAG: response regulator [Desulfovibrionaceae bacterium]|jgi:CheY-like chemotaxis protein|nr:response regulator [Desulfovibrionaceae bacterium]